MPVCLFALLTLVMPPALPQELVARDDRLTIAREASNAGDFETAREELLQALRMQPDDPAAAALLSRACEELGEQDEAVRYAFDALERHLRAEPIDKAAVGKLQERLGKLSPSARAVQKTLQRYVVDLVKIGRKYSSKKFYLNAAEMFGRALAIDPGNKTAADYVVKIQKAAGGAQAAATLAGRIRRSRSPAWIARQDRAHRDWADAYSQRTPNYLVKTNIGYDVFQRAVAALEPVNQFYRHVYGYREQGGGTPVLQIYLFASRTEYEKYRPGVSPTVRGHYTSTEVVTYDPRTDGRPEEALWQTLFHEASHQFTDLVTNTTPPMWLNEGMATYFEGARFRDDGTVQTDGIPRGRLFPLMMAWSDEGAQHGLTRVTLRRLITASKSEYDANAYNHGWGLIYYLRNYEDDQAENIYREPMRRCIKSYKKGGKHDPVERFVSFFIDGVERPEITSLDELDADWQAWIKRLFEEYRLGPRAAPQIAARGDWYREREKYDKARSAYIQALEYRPHDRDTRLSLAETDARLGLDDEASHTLYELIDEGRAAGGPPDAELAARAAQIDPLSAQRSDMVQRLHDNVVTLAATLAREGQPLTAMVALRRLQEVTGKDARLAEQILDIEKRSGRSLQRWRWIFDGESLDGWEGQIDACRIDDLRLALMAGESPVTLIYGEEFRGDRMMQMRAVFAEDELAVFGFAFAIKPGQAPRFGLLASNGQAMIVHWDDQSKAMIIDERAKTAPIHSGQRAAIEIVGTKVRLFVEGRLALAAKLDLPSLDGRMGVHGERTTVSLQEIEIRP